MRMTFNVLRDMALLGEKDRHIGFVCHSSDHAEQHNNLPPEGGERGGYKEEGIKVTETRKWREKKKRGTNGDP